MKLLFFFSLFIIIYIYLGYPLLVFCLAFLKNSNIKKNNFTPYITILIAAYNEEGHIENTLKNKLELDYPKEKLEIIVISDGSSDKTDHIVKQYETHGVKLIRQEPRAGKTSALNLAVPHAKGTILVFSDANSIYAHDALRKLVQNFSDPGIGYVTGKMIYTDPDGTPIGDGCSTYMKYENFLRTIETRTGSIVGVDGGIDAVRKELYIPMNSDLLPDFVLPLNIIEQGYRVIYEPAAILKEPSLKSSKDEYKMRVRVSLRALWALSNMRHLLTFNKFKLFSWQLWSHKVLRYFCFLFLLGSYFANLILYSEGVFFKFFFAVQSSAYILAFISPFLEKNGFNFKPFRFLHYFTLINLAAAHATVKFLFRQKQVVWTPRKG